MKFLLKTLKQGTLCFLVTPTLMSILYYFYATGKVNESTDLNLTIENFINWRYSTEGFIWSVSICFFVVMLSAAAIKFIELKKHKKILYSKAINYPAIFITNTFMFWAGLFFAWSFASRAVPFVPKIEGQEVLCVFIIILAVVSKYLMVKLKHHVVNS